MDLCVHGATEYVCGPCSSYNRPLCGAQKLYGYGCYRQQPTFRASSVYVI